MNIDNIAGTAATGVLVFLGAVVVPHTSEWGTTTAILATLAAIVVAVASALFLGQRVPAERSARQLESDAAWDHALADLVRDAA